MDDSVSELCKRARQFEQYGQIATAGKLYEQILALDPDNAAPYFEAGVFALRQRQTELAIGRVSKAIELDPNRPDFHNILGIARATGGDPEGGARCFRRAIELDPGNAVAHGNLGNNYRECGRWEDAVDCFRDAIAANPQYVDAHINLAGLLSLHGEPAEAVDVYRQAVLLAPGQPEIKIDLAATLTQVASFEEATSILTEVVTEYAGLTRAHSHLGRALVRLGRFAEAIRHIRTAIELEPDSADAQNALGLALQLKSDTAGAIASFRKALAIDPGHAGAHSNILLSSNYVREITPEQRYQEALNFDARHARSLLPGAPAFGNSADPDRVIKIGYVSPDFRSHSVAHFTRKLIGAHDRDRVEVYCYANVARRDAVTQEFEAQTDHWLSIVGTTDEAVSDRIRQDEIDILIDLAGHTADNRLLVFARKPAPIQVNWLGYPDTTGLACMDYRLTDAIADPPGTADRLHVEKLLRLPRGFLCFQIDESTPPVSALPCLTSGHITFGSFNNLAKATPDVVGVWSKILERVPNARMIMKSWALADVSAKTKFLQMFVDRGIAADRIDLRGRTRSREEHLRMYSELDIALDTFPYNGTATTCEALWMGVPVVTLRGDSHAGRVGASIMQHAGLPNLVAETEADYIGLARSLADDSDGLRASRVSLRPGLRNSELMNIEQFAGSLEDAYRDMWKTWCDEKSAR